MSVLADLNEQTELRGTREEVFQRTVLKRLDRLEKLLETINLRLAASPWKPKESQ